MQSVSPVVTALPPPALPSTITKPRLTRRCLAAYNQKASVDTVLDIYRAFDPVALRLLQLADPDGFRIWKLLDMDDPPAWSRGATVLLGDACHPISPFGFSGASMAIEDALTLATLLTPDLAPADVPARLRLYEEIRRPGVARVRDTSREIAAGREDKRATAEYKQFLAEHDAVECAKETLAKHLDEAKSPQS